MKKENADYYKQLKQLEKENAELKEQIKKQQHYIEIICNTQKQRMMLLRYIRRSKNLEKENAELKAQIEKMKCCGNCDNNAYCDKEHYGNNKGCDKWEKAE